MVSYGRSYGLGAWGRGYSGWAFGGAIAEILLNMNGSVLSISDGMLVIKAT